MLADIGEIEARRLFAPAGYSSLFHYCTGALKLSDDAAQRRIQAARTARRFPAIFAMCADGRLSLTTVNQLAPHLTDANADVLLAGAAGKSKDAVAELIARHAPRTEPIGWVQPLPPVTDVSHALARVDVRDAPAPAAPVGARGAHAPARVTPMAAQRFAVQCAIGAPANEALRFARDTTGRDVSSVVEAALLLYSAHLRKRKCGATTKPARRPRQVRSARHVPARVRRIVWERDRGQCTFTSDDGHRCGATHRLQYDHIVPVARGGSSTADNVRLRCHAHNHHEAERVFGAAFMERKRATAADATARADAELRRRDVS